MLPKLPEDLKATLQDCKSNFDVSGLRTAIRRLHIKRGYPRHDTKVQKLARRVDELSGIFSGIPHLTLHDNFTALEDKALSIRAHELLRERRHALAAEGLEQCDNYRDLKKRFALANGNVALRMRILVHAEKAALASLLSQEKTVADIERFLTRGVFEDGEVSVLTRVKLETRIDTLRGLLCDLETLTIDDDVEWKRRIHLAQSSVTLSALRDRASLVVMANIINDDTDIALLTTRRAFVEQVIGLENDAGKGCIVAIEDAEDKYAFKSIVTYARVDDVKAMLACAPYIHTSRTRFIFKSILRALLAAYMVKGIRHDELFHWLAVARIVEEDEREKFACDTISERIGATVHNTVA